MPKTQTLPVIIRHGRNAVDVLIDGLIDRVARLHEQQSDAAKSPEELPDNKEFQKDCDRVIENLVEEAAGRIFGADSVYSLAREPHPGPLQSSPEALILGYSHETSATEAFGIAMVECHPGGAAVSPMQVLRTAYLADPEMKYRAKEPGFFEVEFSDGGTVTIAEGPHSD